MATFTDGSKRNLQVAKEQTVKNGGPTVEGKYKLNLKPDPERKAEIRNGDIVRDPENGMQSLDGMTDPDQPGKTFIAPAWGKNRIRMIPVSVKQTANDPKRKRDISSFYFHDSTKGESHGCHEVDTEFFDQLKQYRSEGNDEIFVKVQYPTPNHKTNGGTEKKVEKPTE